MKHALSPTAAAKPGKSQLYDGIFFLAAALVLCVAVSIAAAKPKDDIAWLLYVSQQFLRGKVLYVDLIEINPPLIVLLLAVPTRVAMALEASSITVFMTGFAVLILACAWSAAGLLKHYSPIFADPRRTTAAVTMLLALLPGPEFGQHEHLAMIFVLPFLALLAVRLQGGRISAVRGAVVGLAAGVGFAIKPHYLAVFVLLEFFALTRGLRRLRPETVGVVLVAITYGTVILVAFPAYLVDTVPLVYQLYSASNVSLAKFLAEARYLLLGGTIAAGLVGAGIERQSREPLFLVLVVFALGGALVYFVQGKSWFYQQLPCSIALALALLYWAAEALAGGSTTTRARQIALPSVAATLGTLGTVALERLNPSIDALFHPERTDLHRLVTLIRDDNVTSLLQLSDTLSPAFPAVNISGIEWASRFGTAWALRGELWRERRGDAGGAPRQIRQRIIDDFLTRRPVLVLTDEHARIDYLRELMAFPAFAEVWASSYSFRASVDGFRVFERRPGG